MCATRGADNGINFLHVLTTCFRDISAVILYSDNEVIYTIKYNMQYLETLFIRQNMLHMFQLYRVSIRGLRAEVETA
jgi:hypothetical protein